MGYQCIIAVNTTNVAGSVCNEGDSIHPFGGYGEKAAIPDVFLKKMENRSTATGEQVNMRELQEKIVAQQTTSS